MIVKIRAVTTDQTGSFTLEASLALPVILLTVIALLSFSLMLYNRSDLYATAAAAADRSALNWDNSSKDFATGAVEPSRYDGLYWRTGSDSFSDAFSFLVRNEGSVLELPVPSNGRQPTLPLAKLQLAALTLSSDIQGTLSYTNHLYSRQVEVNLDRHPSIPSIVKSWFSVSSSVALKASVTEPVELIRTVDFVRTTAGQIKEMLTKRGDIHQNTQSTNSLPAPVKLTSEKEAAEYLRTLLGISVSVYVNTPSGQQRKLDALDPDGLFHEAKFGYTSKTESVEQQMAKDLELLNSAEKVKGVVWHFFRDSRNGKLGPSKPLRKELEKRGIIVVIHS